MPVLTVQCELAIVTDLHIIIDMFITPVTECYFLCQTNDFFSKFYLFFINLLSKISPMNHCLNGRLKGNNIYEFCNMKVQAVSHLLYDPIVRKQI